MRPIRESRRRDSSGFTLVELLVVVLIIGVLAAVAIPVFVGQQQKAQDAVAQFDLQEARIAMNGYKTTHGGHITTDISDLTTFGMTGSPGVSTPVVHPETPAGAFCIDARAASSSWFRVTDSAGVEPGNC